MKNLLNKEHSCCKIHIYITNEKQCLPFFYRKPLFMGYLPFLQENFDPQFYDLTSTSQKFQPNYK